MGASIDEKMFELEKAFQPYPGAVAGTALSRILMDNALLPKQGIKAVPDSQSRMVWCLALGGMTDRKQFFYAATITGALRKAEQAAVK